ncbi:MAG: hypothetical protein OEN52_01460 [Gammaproteobacteria bacterium]|nr:hypothetical protein [Gammaproteobacteria bacterium]MDH3559604.1 hypothetical protein [Gammaproteobacteria bacterium]
MNINRIVGLLGVLVLLLCGCGQMQSYTNKVLPPVFEGGQGVNDWLAELHSTRNLSKDELSIVLGSWEQDFRYDPNLSNRLRLVLLLAAGEPSVSDRQRARKLLDEINPLPEGPGERELIDILQQFLAGQQEARGKINELSKQVKEQGQRIKELEQQQRDLTTIEQSIQQREKSAGE